MNFKPFILVAFIILASCSNKEYHDHDVEFLCPDDWSITEDGDMAGDARYIIIESDPPNMSGVILLYRFEKGTSEEMALGLAIERDNSTDGTKLVYSDLKLEKLNKHQARTQTYKGLLAGHKTKGKNWAFSTDARTYCIMTYCAAEDDQKSQTGFRSFLKSFNPKK